MNQLIPTKFVNPPSNSLYCPLCQGLFQDPIISTTCGHTFCRKCIDGCLQVICPLDEVIISISNVVPNRAVQGQLEDLLIYCQHGLYRVDSDDEFQIDQEGCKEHIALGRRLDHEQNCLSAWVPCPNSSNHCGKFRKHDIENHLLVCTHQPCKYKGCEFYGGKENLQKHVAECIFSTNSIDWNMAPSLDDDGMDGLHAKYLVKAVKNLNDRVVALEKGKEDVLSSVEKCNINVINLSIEVEKLAHTVEQLRITQNAMIRMSSQSTSDIAAAYEYNRKTVSSSVLNMYDMRYRSSSSGHSQISNFSEPKSEAWKMPLSFKCIGTFRGHSGIIRAMITKGPYVFSAGANAVIKVWDIQEEMKNSRGCCATLTGHSGEIHALCTSGRFLYSAGSDKSIKVWNLDKVQLHNSREDAHSDVIGAIASTGKYIFSGSYSSIKVWRAVSLELMHTISEIDHWVRAFAVDHKKKKVYSGSHNAVHIWTAVEPFNTQGHLTHSHGSVYSLAISKQYLILGTYNRNTHLYNINTNLYVKCLNGHLGIINDLLVSPSGNFLFTASYDNTIQLWDLLKLLPYQVLSRHEGSVNCMALRGDTLFTGSEDKEIKVYFCYQGLESKNLMVV